MIYLDALNISTGGGLVLLRYLERELIANGIAYKIMVRDVALSQQPEAAIVGRPTIFGRYRLYRKYVRDDQPESRVLCFGNFPPPYALRCKTITYFHRPALANMNTEQATLKQKLLYNLKKRYLRSLLANTDTFLFQSTTISGAFFRTYPKYRGESGIVPFFDLNVYQPLAERAQSMVKKPYFIYVSNDSPHKNHAVLLKAWELLYERGLTPELRITIPQDSRFMPAIAEMQTRGVHIINLGLIPHKDVLEQTLTAKYAIFPSLAETLGLGILEALYCRCSILAADLPYTYEVIQPSSTFHPDSPDDIARCVEQALNTPQLPLAEQVMRNHIDSLLQALQNKNLDKQTTSNGVVGPHRV
ncbi:MAG: glycosyltransferase [Bacteroidota bacterium]